MKKNIVRRVSNRFLASIARIVPGTSTLRPWVHRLRGVKILGTVFIGEDVYLENEFPEAVEIHDGVQLSMRCVVIAHTRGEGKIIIGKNAFIGANCVISAASGRTTRIGEGAVVAAGCAISSSVPDRALIGHPKHIPIATVTVPLTWDASYEQFIAGLKSWPKPGERKKQI
jgi:acetyltransferase-like isoleucine patch superfamily enzyme